MTVAVASVVTNNASYNAFAGTTVVQSITVSAGDKWIAWGTCDNSGSFTSVADATNGSWGASIAALNDTGDAQRTAIWLIEAPAAGTYNVTLTTSSVNFRALRLIRITGAASGTSLDGVTGQVQATPTTSTDATTSGNAASTKQPALVVGISYNPNGNVPTNGTGFGSDENDTTEGTRVESKRVTATGNQAATFTATNNSGHMTYVIVLDESGASGGGVSAIAGIDDPPARSRFSGGGPRLSSEMPLTALVAAAALTSIGWVPVEPVVSRPAISQTTRANNPPVSSDILPLQSAVMQWGEPPARGKWAPSRADNPPVASHILPLQSAYMQWAERPAVGRGTTSRACNETIRDRILPLQSAYLQAEPIAVGRGTTNRALNETVRDSIFPSAYLQVEPSATGKWVSARALNEAIRDRILPLQSAYLQTEPPAIGRGTTNRACNETIRDRILPLQSAYLQTEPPAFGKWSSARALNETVRDSILAIQTVYLQVDPPAFGKWVSTRALNEAVRDSILATPSQSAFQQVDPPAFGKWVSTRALNETVRDRILPLQSAYLQVEPPAIGKWVSKRASNEAVRDSILPLQSAYLQWAELTRSLPWSVSRAINETVHDDLLPLQSAFMQWAEPSKPLPWWVSRARNETVRDRILPIQSAYLQWAEPAVRATTGLTKRAEPEFVLPSAIFATAYLGWSVDAARGAPFKLNRLDSAYVLDATVVPATTAFFAWFSPAPTGTAVSSRRVDPPQFLGTFIPPPVLTGTPWANDAFRPRQYVSRSSSEPIVAALAQSAFIAWADAQWQPAVKKRRADQDSTIGSAAALPPMPWSSEAQRSAVSQRQQSIVADTLRAVQVLSEMDWSAPVRAGTPNVRRIQIDDQVFPVTVPPTIQPFLAWSLDTPPRLLYPIRPEIANPLDVMSVVIPVVPTVVPTATILAASADPAAPVATLTQDLLLPTATILDE